MPSSNFSNKKYRFSQNFSMTGSLAFSFDFYDSACFLRADSDGSMKTLLILQSILPFLVPTTISWFSLRELIGNCLRFGLDCCLRYRSYSSCMSAYSDFSSFSD